MYHTLYLLLFWKKLKMCRTKSNPNQAFVCSLVVACCYLGSATQQHSRNGKAKQQSCSSCHFDRKMRDSWRHTSLLYWSSIISLQEFIFWEVHDAARTTECRRWDSNLPGGHAFVSLFGDYKWKWDRDLCSTLFPWSPTSKKREVHEFAFLQPWFFIHLFLLCVDEDGLRIGFSLELIFLCCVLWVGLSQSLFCLVHLTFVPFHNVAEP